MWRRRQPKDVRWQWKRDLIEAANRRRAEEIATRLDLTVNCAHCNGPVSAWRLSSAQQRRSTVLCSSACARLWLRGENHPFHRGNVTSDRGPEWESLAETIRVRDGRCCRRCGKPETENGARLSVDHLVPWRTFTDKTLANDPENLVSLCRSCHTKKTVGPERAYLRGDGLALAQFKRECGL